jgi:hypothetical protein
MLLPSKSPEYVKKDLLGYGVRAACLQNARIWRPVCVRDRRVCRRSAAPGRDMSAASATGVGLAALDSSPRLSSRARFLLAGGVGDEPPVDHVGQSSLQAARAAGRSPATGVALDQAAALALPLLDKDVILESLFDTLGVGDQRWRSRLSRASDEILFRVADASSGAVLDNWWHHDSAPQRIRQLGGRTVEVFCDCDPDRAARRFAGRVRHPGHLDAAVSAAELARRADHLRQHHPGPLRLGGALLVLDTNGPVNSTALDRRIAGLLDR